VLDVETVRPLIAALPERQRTVLTLRFFEDLTQSQIAERIGCSQMHVSRLLAKALGTLRSHVRAPELAVTG
jgi:RNA polymerase sigma-B factor